MGRIVYGSLGYAVMMNWSKLLTDIEVKSFVSISSIDWLQPYINIIIIIMSMIRTENLIYNKIDIKYRLQTYQLNLKGVI